MEQLAPYIGYAAALGTTLSFLPQAIQILRTKNTHAISLVMYVSFVVGTWLWFVYGLMAGSWPVMIANLVTGVLATTILRLKLRYR